MSVKKCLDLKIDLYNQLFYITNSIKVKCDKQLETLGTENTIISTLPPYQIPKILHLSNKWL